MDESRVSMVMGLAVLLFAVISVVGHYRREQRRAQMLRLLDQAHRGQSPRG
ncbi:MULTISPECIES: hypothetical protein [unclassified Burkholderia]|uniref:hypothetical protein n=1 Tax=unclassified Burkholderia TaxID=2613784 RepID=UPI001639876B|nr:MULTISPECIES: hypothetical protein [unclassified Burkholderia]